MLVRQQPNGTSVTAPVDSEVTVELGVAEHPAAYPGTRDAWIPREVRRKAARDGIARVPGSEARESCEGLQCVNMMTLTSSQP